jgi:hypothetical protein
MNCTLREKWCFASTYVAKKNKKLLQNVLLLYFATASYFSQLYMSLPKTIFLVVASEVFELILGNIDW